MIKILVVDDELPITNLVSAYLKPEGYEVYTASDGLSGLKAARAYKPDILILDVMLPGMDGIEMLSHLRRESDMYIIMLTARTEETDKIVGLSMGADDYMTKPFSPRELVARVKAALRRLQTSTASGQDNRVLAFRHVRMDVGARTVHVDDTAGGTDRHRIRSTESPGREPRPRVSREQLLEKVWGGEYFGEIARGRCAPRSRPAEAGRRGADRHRARRGLSLRRRGLMIQYVRRHLGAKLLLSYLAIILVGGAVLAVISESVLPASFNRHMARFGTVNSGQGPGSGTGMNSGGMGRGGSGGLAGSRVRWRNSMPITGPALTMH